VGIGRCWVCSKCNIFIQVTDGIIRKTQIALQYAYSVENKCSVFWVHSDSYTRFSRDYREIANRAQLPKNPVAEEELLFEIRKWLESPTSGPWVMILDNADNLLEMFPPVSEDKKPVGLSKFLPQGSKGTILITTRDRVVASRLANMDMLEVRAMGPREAGTLFLRYAPDAISSEEDKAVFPQLLDTLKFLPLAIVGAAAFMRENGVSSTEYFELYSKGKQAQSELLSSEFNDFRRGSEVPEAVLTTYFTLFERLQIQSPMAADFLRLIAFFDRNGIQKELLMSSGLEGVDNPVRFTKAIGKLLSFSLMTRGADGNTYQVHRLVHMSIEVYFSEDRVKWRSQAQNTLLKFFQVSPAEELDLIYIDWKGFANYAPHVLAATVQLPSAETPSTVERKLLYQMGRYLYFLGHLADAEIHYRRCISDLPSINTKEELLTDPIFRGYCHLGVVLKIQEKLQESIWLYEEMYERYETILGPSHGCVAGIHCRLITILIKLGTAGLPRAEELSRRVLGLIQESPIANISTIVGSMHILGKVLRLQGKFDDAEKIYQDAVIEAHGRGDDELSLLCVARLVQILQHRKRYNIAEKVLQLAVEMYKTIEIPEAPPTGQITSLTKLANALMKQRKFDQAEEIIRRTVTLYEKRHGPDGLATLTWSGTLSTVLCSQEKYEEAEKFMRHLVTRCEDILGPIHPVTLRNVTNLATVVQETGRYDEAEQLFQRTVEGYEQVFGPDCHTTILCTMWRAVVRAYQGKHSQAVSECMEACEKYKKIYGETQNLKNVMIRVAWFLLRAKELPEGSREPIQGTFDKETAGVALSSYFQNDRSHEEYMFIVVKPGVVMYCEPLD